MRSQLFSPNLCWYWEAAAPSWLAFQYKQKQNSGELAAGNRTWVETTSVVERRNINYCADYSLKIQFAKNLFVLSKSIIFLVFRVAAKAEIQNLYCYSKNHFYNSHFLVVSGRQLNLRFFIFLFGSFLIILLISCSKLS